MDERWGDFTFDESQTFTNKFLNLPNSIMENVCRFLSTRDQYMACLIHPNWTPAAQTVLWEKPRFAQPTSFRAFLNTMKTVRKVSLLVQDIYLIFLDHQSSIFQPIVKSNMERHGIDPNPLSNPNFLVCISKTCEHLKSLSFYGWHMDSTWMERISMLAPELTSIYIIGGNVKSSSPLALSGLLNRLTSLRLDGIFNIDEKWAEMLVMKGKLIQQLQLSLQKMNVTTISKICSSSGLTALTDLTLTDAEHLTDQLVHHIVTAFPYLRKLCLEGTIHVTFLSIAHALKHCSQLTSLELRAHFKTLDYPLKNDSVIAFEELLMYDQDYDTLTRFLLENLQIDDTHLATLAPHLHLVQTLGFKNCPSITSEGLRTAVESMKYLRTVHVLNCVNIDSSLFSKFASMGNVIQTLFRVHFESSGAINSRDVYEFCRAGIEYNLRQIRFVGYYDLQSSAIGNFNDEEYEGTRIEDGSVITLNRASIDALALSNDPEFSTIPNGRYLTGKQIVNLARNLDISVEVLLDKMDISCESDDGYDESVTVEEEFNKTTTASKSISFSNAAIESDKPASNSRLYALKHQSSSQRPTTPALWSNDFEQNDVTYGDETNSDKSSNDESSGFTEEDNTDEYVYEDEDEEEEEEQNEDCEETPSPHQWASLGPNSGPGNTGSEISLGGWGVTSNNTWITPSKPQASEQSIIPPIVPPQSTYKPPSPQPQHHTPWTGYTEEMYKDRWQQQSHEYNSKAIFSGRRHEKSFRNDPIVSDNDGWGSAQDVIAWDGTQGYVKSVIEEQKKTAYWNLEDGEWKQINDTAPKATTTTTTKQVSERAQDASSSSTAPILFSDIASGLHSNKANGGILITQSHRSKNQRSNNHIDRSTPVRAPSRLRSDSLISSDGSVSWNDDVNVHIKLSNKEAIPSHVGNAASSSTPRFSIPRTTESTNRTSKWASAEEWKNIKETSNNDSAISEQPSWQNNFPPEAIADKPAKLEWKNYSRPRTSTPPRSTAPPRKIDTRWAAFSDSNSNSVSPPSRNSTSSPPRSVAANGYSSQKPNVPAAALDFQLIDTTNTTSSPSKPTLKGDVWETLSSLEIPATQSVEHAVLVPQNACTTVKFSAAAAAAPIIPTEVSEWSPLGSDSSKEQDNVPTFRFQETISGTITAQEIQDEAEARNNDNLVDVEDLISSAAPVMSPNYSQSTAVASPVPSHPKISTDLLNMDQMETTDITTTTTDPASLKNNLTDFTSLMAEVTEPTVENNTSIVDTSAPNVNITNTISNDLPTTTSDAVPAATTPNDTQDRASPEIQEKQKTRVKLRVKVGDSCVDMALDAAKDLEGDVRRFCEEYDILSSYDNLLKQANNAWAAKQTRRILGKASKKKKVPTTPSSLF